MDGKVCAFTGHRNVAKNFSKKDLERAIESAVKDGFTIFACGGALGFDTLCEQAVLKMRSSFPQIKLFLFLPCQDQCAGWTKAQKDLYQQIYDLADYIDCPNCSYFDGCMKERNAKLVQNASRLICYYDGTFASGTGQTVRMAQRKNIPILNLYTGENDG